MKIYLIGSMPREDLSNYQIEVIDDKFEQFTNNDILIINSARYKIPIFCKGIQSLITKWQLIIIDLVGINLDKYQYHYKGVKSVSLLIEAIETDNYFEVDNIPIRYQYVDRGFTKTLIVMQSSGVKWTDEKMYNQFLSEQISQIEYDRFKNAAHRKYVFYKTFNSLDYNLMFVQDNYNEGYGWFLLHNNQRIDSQIAQGISQVLAAHQQEESDSIIFGSSKGAYGAIVVGQHLTTRVFTQYPVYDVSNRYQRIKANDYKLQLKYLKLYNPDFFNTKTDVFLEGINSGLKGCSGRLTILAGVADRDTSIILSKCYSLKTEFDFFLNLNYLTHGKYASTSAGQMIAIITNNSLEEYNITKIDTKIEV